MQLPVDILHWVSALAPVIVLLILMLGFRCSALQAAPVGVAAAVIAALTLFKANVPLILTETVKGIWSAGNVIMVIWPAILIYELTKKTGAMDSLCEGFRYMLPNELIRIMAFGLGVVGFLIGVTGFGVPVAVGAPLLIAIGVKPVYAVVIALIGESWGSTFGTLAVAWDALRLSVELDTFPGAVSQTALWAGGLIWGWNMVVCLAVCWMYGKMTAVRRGLPAAALLSLIQGGGQLLMAQVNSTLACFLPACAAMAASVLLGKTELYGVPWQIDGSPIMERAAKDGKIPQQSEKIDLLSAFLPYIVLTAVTLTVLLIPPVKNALGSWSFGPSLPETATGYGYITPAVQSYSPVAPLTHAGFFLFVSAVISLVYYLCKGKINRQEAREILRESLRKTLPSGLSVIMFLVMSRIMSGSGQTRVLAAGMAEIMGTGYIVCAPLVGLMGAFMTGSNMASNILFGEFQMTTASMIGADTCAILGAQTAGGAIGTACCPGNIILGCTTTGIMGSESRVMKKVLPLCAAAALIMGLILIIL